MINYLNLLITRSKYLQSVLARLKAKYRDWPEGTINIVKKDGKIYYYRYFCENNKVKYIKQDEVNLIRALFQKYYISKLRRATEKELAAIDYCIKHVPNILPEDVYGSMREERQKYVDPEIESDEMYISRWKAEKYEPLNMPIDPDADEPEPERYNGFRSKSEVIIAHMLDGNNIPYKYEKPLKLNDHFVFPDFTILDVRNRREIYFEHFGKMDDSLYLDNALIKLTKYNRAGIFQGDRLLVSMESSSRPLNIQAVERMVLNALGRL